MSYAMGVIGWRDQHGSALTLAQVLAMAPSDEERALVMFKHREAIVVCELAALKMRRELEDVLKEGGIDGGDIVG